MKKLSARDWGLKQLNLNQITAASAVNRYLLCLFELGDYQPMKINLSYINIYIKIIISLKTVKQNIGTRNLLLLFHEPEASKEPLSCMKLKVVVSN